MVRLRCRARPFVVLWCWLAFGLVLNATMVHLASEGRRTAMLMQVTLPIFASLGFLTTGLLTSKRGIRVWCLIGATSYLVFWSWRFLQREADSDFSLYTGPVLWVLLTITAATVIWARMSDAPPQPLRDPVLVTGLAVLVSYAPVAALEPVSALLFATDPDLTFVLWIARSCVLIVGSLLFTLAFAWTLPPRLSPGSPSSAA